MKRVVSLYLPTWPTDRVRRRLAGEAPSPDAPLVTIGREARKRVVTSADLAAQRLGIRRGMAATQAGALVADLHMHDADRASDDDALERLAHWAYRLYAPVVAADPPDGLYFDATGATHRYGSDANLLDDLVTRLAKAGVLAQAAMAPTYGAAHALARYSGRANVVIGGAVGDAVRGLPVAALRLPAATLDGLRALGFDTVGETERTPRAPLVRRAGREVGLRLDQMYGHAAELWEPVVIPELVRVRRHFAEPIGAPETLARYIGELVDDLCAALEAAGQGARLLDLLFTRVDNRIEAVRVGMAKPVRDRKRLTKLLIDKLETVDPGFGVEAMTLAAPGAEPLLARQSAAAFGGEADADVAGLIDTLANRIGASRLYRAVAVESDVPERSVGRAAPLTEGVRTDWPEHWPRPTRLLARPEPVETMALLPDQPPVHFTWRGTRRRIRRADGPERIFGEWWKRDAELDAVRDYFQVEDDQGERFWLYRAGDGEDPGTGSHRWFLHGVFG